MLFAQFAGTVEEDDSGDRDPEEEGVNQPKDDSGVKWLRCIQLVSDLTKLNWNQVWDLDIGTFLTYLKYANWEIAKKNEMIRKQNMKMK